MTGYREYMEDAFDVNAFHYLLKPIDERKFQKIFNRALKDVSTRRERKKRSVIVKSNGMQKKILLKDILLIDKFNTNLYNSTQICNNNVFLKLLLYERCERSL